jgi:hypothetical protein
MTALTCLSQTPATLITDKGQTMSDAHPVM